MDDNQIKKSPIERENIKEIMRLSRRKRFFDKIKKMNEEKPSKLSIKTV